MPNITTGNNFIAEVYSDPDTLKERWAVLDKLACVWYFPKRYGKSAAEAMARRLNAKASKENRNAN